MRNWYELNKSISEKKPEFRWLLKFDIDEGFPNFENIDILIDIYTSLLTELSNVDVKILKNWHLFRVANLQLKIKVNQNNINELKNHPETKIKFDDAEIKLHNYFEAYLNTYKDIQINIFSFKKDYVKIWIETFKEQPPEFVHEFKDLAFHIFEQWKDEVKHLNIKNILTSASFMNLFFTL